MASSVVSGACISASFTYPSNSPTPRVTTLINTHSSFFIPSLRLSEKILSVKQGRNRLVIRASEKMTTPTEKLGVKIHKNPPESKLTELGIRSWPKWGCPPSKFPWTYESKETCYLLKGKVKVYPEGAGSEAVEFGAGDLVEFPKGMSCTWDVSEAVDKHYKFE